MEIRDLFRTCLQNRNWPCFYRRAASRCSRRYTKFRRRCGRKLDYAARPLNQEGDNIFWRQRHHEFVQFGSQNNVLGKRETPGRGKQSPDSLATSRQKVVGFTFYFSLLIIMHRFLFQSLCHSQHNKLRRSPCEEITEQIPSVFIVKVRGTFGPRHDDLKSISMLNRGVRWVDGRTEDRECIFIPCGSST